MKRSYIVVNIVCIIILLLSIAGCSNSADFTLTENRRVKVQFKKLLSPNGSKDTTISNITIYGLGAKDTVPLYDKQSTASTSLLLDQNHDSCLFVFSIDDTSRKVTTHDTVQFNYSREISFVSSDDGFNTIFTLKSANYKKFKNTKIDSLLVVSNEVNALANSNVYLYIKSDSAIKTTTNLRFH